MTQNITIKKLSAENLADYEKLTAHGDDGNLCYCSFWHQKWASMEEYKKLQKENPSRLKNCVVDRVQSGFHVGVVAYADGVPCAWISVGPLPDFYWTWRRVGQVGDAAKDIAGIVCFTMAPEFRGKGLQAPVLEALKQYGRELGWKSIEAYPFGDAAHKEHGVHVQWAGFLKGYEKAGFQLAGEHWLSNPHLIRHLCHVDLV